MKLKYNDEGHAYWVDGVRCKSVTTIAKIPDDTYALNMWRNRQIVVGMALDPTLVESAAAHYDNRNHIDRVAEQAMVAARSHEAASRGTSAHRITERIDLDLPIIDTPLAREVREAWLGALQIARLEIVPEFVERIVVYPDEHIAGRFDRLVRNKRTRKLQVMDLKTGSRAVKYPHPISVQLALYAHAPYMAGPLDRGGYTEQFEPMPEVDDHWAVVLHMPSDATVEVHKIDIRAGWETVQRVIFPTLRWRERRDLVAPLSSLMVSQRPATEERVTWIKGRLALLAMMDDPIGGSNNVKGLVAAQWPENVPTRPPWSEADVSEIAAVLTVVEAEVQMPFAAADPRLL